MRRWSSGIALGEVGEEELHHQATDHAQRKERETVEEGAAVGARRPHQELDAYQAAVDQRTDEDAETDNGEMEAEAVHRRSRHGLAPRARPLGRFVDANDTAFGHILNALQLPGVAAARCPVDKRHADDDGKQDAARRRCEGQVRALGPVIGVEDRRQTGGGAVTTLEADRNDGADGLWDAKHRCQKHDRHSETDDVLAPGDDLAVRQLRPGDPPDASDRRDEDSQEEGRENDVDEESW